jgi:hypothetical protein
MKIRILRDFSVNYVFTFQGCYAAWVVVSLFADVSGEPVGSFSKAKHFENSVRS